VDIDRVVSVADREAMLADLLVAVTVLGLMMSANFVLLDQGQRVYQTGAARVEAQQSARIALTRIARDLRTAGSAPRPASFDAISVADAGRVVLHRDENGDGVIAGPRETITWKLDDSILRRDAGGGAQPIATGAHALAFAYFDADGAPTTTPGRVRSVHVTLTTEGVGPRGALLRTTVSTHVRLRNR
jgi:hypothetical protein